VANTRITQGVIKPNEDYDVRHINATGIITATNLNLTGVLTYEDVTNVDSIGVITARKGIVSSGVVTATAFHGDGSALTGIDATALKDSGGNVKIQAQSSGAVHTGISTFDTINVGSGVTIESNGQATFTGIVTFGSNSTTIGDNVINVGTALTLGHTQGVQFHTQNLHADGFEINNINASGIITAAQFSGDGSNLANLPAGLGTALSSTQSSPLNKIYYTNTVLPVESTITVDTPASASAAYTQYADISVGTGADLIISDGDDLIPDVLGLRPDGTFGGGALGRMRVDKIVGKDATSAVNFEKGIVVTGVVTATSFSGDGSALTGIDTDLVSDTSPQLGGTLDTNNQDITFNGAQNVSWDSSAADFIFNDYAKINLGTDKDFRMYQDGNNTILQSSNTSGGVYLQGALVQVGSETGEAGVKYVKDNQVELYFNNNKKIETTNTGAVVTGILTATSFSGDGSALTGISAGGASNITFNSGNGISFAATADGTGSSSVSELLDDYESGEWTGTINSGSANINNPWYVKIGKLVIGGGSITAISDISSSNSIIVNGLPFSNSGGNTGRGSVTASKNNKFDRMCDCYVSGTTVRFMVSSLSTGSWDYLRHSSVVQSSGSITFAFNYQTS